ncbi:MAG TPA: ATP-binding protein [Burkholderiaceae bacterium]|nr:ATP-binding protein [Burkholderiaceae bacterium]
MSAPASSSAVPQLAPLAPADLHEPGAGDRAPSGSYWTSLRYLALSRLLIALTLLGYLPLTGIGSAPELPLQEQLFQRVALAYVIVSVLFLAVSRLAGRGFAVQLAAQIVADIVALTLLTHAAGGVRSGLAVLLIAPVAGAAVLSTLTTSLFFASLATLLLLGETFWRMLLWPATDAAFVPAGVIGAALLATAVVVNRLARRLALHERLAQRHAAALRRQLAINELVIAELQDGVIVLGGDARPVVLNAAARMMLGDAGEGSPALREALARLRAERQPNASVDFAVGEQRLRARPLGSDATVIVLEDLSRLDERAQQLKLASMGRLSASIAHEIRNPLGAIRHANGLLAEGIAALPQPARLNRLTAIVEDNCVRINRIVEDVLSISRRNTAAPEPVSVPGFLRDLLPELAAQAGVDPQRIEVAATSAQPLWFDAAQLRQLLVNLLTNALRYASGDAGAVRIEWLDVDGAPRLRICDDGAGIPAAMQQHLFEPFFTTESRGTGLGLYLARELCRANGARIRYEPAGDNRRYHGAFVIEPAPAPRPTTTRP